MLARELASQPESFALQESAVASKKMVLPLVQWSSSSSERNKSHSSDNICIDKCSCRCRCFVFWGSIYPIRSCTCFVYCCMPLHTFAYFGNNCVHLHTKHCTVRYRFGTTSFGHDFHTWWKLTTNVLQWKLFKCHKIYMSLI